jgi:hypothetical protein
MLILYIIYIIYYSLIYIYNIYERRSKEREKREKREERGNGEREGKRERGEIKKRVFVCKVQYATVSCVNVKRKEWEK